MRHAKTALVCSLLLAGPTILADEIPVVSASSFSKIGQKEAPNKELLRKSGEGATVVLATPGTNQIVPLAMHHLNRIITPFHHPKITSSSKLTTEIRQNVIYVGIESDMPATLFISDEGDEEVALNFTILPQRIPSREIIIKLAQQRGNFTPRAEKEAKRWETSQPYTATIRGLMRQLALGEVPQGYSLSENGTGAALTTCKQEGVHFDFSKGQQLVGHHLVVGIGLAKNITGKPLEFNEQSCANWKVAAVAAWPTRMLPPGGSAEIYVVQKAVNPQQQQVKRPSLLRDAQ